MKKISRRSFITAMAAVSAAGVLAACGSSSSSTASSVASSAVSSEATSSAASMDETGTHTVVDHGGNEVEVPNKVTRVVIDQIPILSTYMAYFEGSAPYIVGYCGSFKSVISDTVLKNIAPELLESSDTVYAQSDLNIEEIMKLNPDVILYNAGNSSHAEILKASGIPSIGFATVGASTEADPMERYPTNAMSVADEALMLNRKGEFFYGPAAEILNEENISYSFDVQVLVDELHYQGRSVRSIVPVALREETAV